MDLLQPKQSSPWMGVNSEEIAENSTTQNELLVTQLGNVPAELRGKTIQSRSSRDALRLRMKRQKDQLVESE